MEPITDWAHLWSQVVTARHSGRQPAGDERPDDVWSGRAPDFDARVRRRWHEAPVTRDTLVRLVDGTTTLLDIGAGTGAWAVPLARHVARITALEPSGAMREILARNLVAAGVTNVEIVEGSWPDALVPPHDVVLCSHAMYATTDLVGFVDRMRATARRRCVLVVRAPSRDGVLAEAARIAWGHPHFAPDFTIAYNVLLDQGLLPDVAMERFARREADPSPSSAAALEEVKRRLGLDPGDGPHDDALLDLLRRRLVERDGRLEWPGTVRSAVIHWSTEPPAESSGPAPWTAQGAAPRPTSRPRSGPAPRP